MDCFSKSLNHIETDWIIESTLGKGSFGEVFKAKKINGEINGESVDICVIKKIDKSKLEQANIKRFQNEIEALNKLKSETQFFIYYYGCGEDKKYLYIYMEYIDGAISISDKLKSLDWNKFEEEEIMVITNQLVGALRIIHANKIIHRDVKGENILLVNGLDVKIIDFGLSRLYGDEGSKFKSAVGSPSHIAPEVALQNSNTGCKSDIYSLGCTIIEMTGGSLEKDDNGKPNIPKNLKSRTLKTIIHDCLIYEVNARVDLDVLSKRIDYWLLEKEKLNSLKHLNILPFPSTKKLSNYVNILPIKTTLSNKSEIFTLPLFNQPLEPELIPSGVTRLILPSFNQHIYPGSIPNTVETLDLASFNQLIEPGSIPCSVKTLILPSFNQLIEPGSIPCSVTSLFFGVLEKKIECDAIPKSVTLLDLGTKYNIQENGDDLPDTLVELISGFNFTAPIHRKVIPSSVRKLSLPNYNHRLLVNSLPKSIYHLTLGTLNPDNISTLEYLPPSVFKLGINYNGTLDEDTHEELSQGFPSFSLNGMDEGSRSPLSSPSPANI